jgi:anti-sigma factor RsiW
MAGCVRPGEISDDDLIAYAAGDRPARVRAHVRDCPRCAAVAAGYAADEDRLGRLLFRFDCPSALALGEYQLGMLPAATSRRIAAHLTRCPHCAAELATASGFLDDAGAAAPSGQRMGRAARQALERIVAQLIPEPLAPAVGLRGGPRPVTLRYSADDLRLTLHPQPADRPRGQMQLLGFAERQGAELAGLTGVKARLLDRDGRTAATAAVDEIGNFILGPVVPGDYTLELILPNRLVIVPDLPLTR